MDLFALLSELQIDFERYDHPAFFTIGDSEAYLKENPIPGAQAKSLFLRNSKGTQHYMVVVEGSKRADLKALGEELNEKLSFASPERMMKYLGITPGSVSPMALINDTEKQVQVLLDKDVFNQELVQFHPLINTATLVMPTNDVLKFIEATGHRYVLVNL